MTLEAQAVEEKSGFEPRIVGFLCNWCSYAGADKAGSSQLPYPPNMSAIRVMCTGRIDPQFVLKAFEQGADGVLILGCHPGDCHYAEGNYHARRRFALLRPFLEYLGIEKERFGVEWVSAAEGKRFSQVVLSFTEEISQMGPRGEKEGVRA